MFEKFAVGFVAAYSALVHSITPAATYHAPRTYDVTAQVIAVENSTVQVNDAHGNIWELYADNVEVGDNVVITIDTNATDNIADDQVIGIR